MKTSSAKAKGRRLQQEVCKDLLEALQGHGLEPDDITSRGMGQNGLDVIESPAARRLLNLAIECKNVEALTVPTTFYEHFKKYEKDESLKLLIHSRNHQPEPLVTLRWPDLLQILKKTING